MSKITVNKNTTLGSFSITTLGILLMVIGFIGENGTDYNDLLFATIFTVGFWLFIIPFIVIGIIFAIIITAVIISK